MKKLKNLICVFMIAFCVNTVQADEAKENHFAVPIAKQIEASRSVVEDLQDDPQVGSQKWFLNIIRCKLWVSVGVQVPWLASVQVTPFVDIFFVR